MISSAIVPLVPALLVDERDGKGSELSDVDDFGVALLLLPLTPMARSHLAARLAAGLLA